MNKHFSSPSKPTLLGTVQDVHGSSVSVVINASQVSGLAFVRGQAYRVGQIGSFVRIPIGYVDLYGIVSQVGASAIPDKLSNESSSQGQRWLTVQLVGEGYAGSSFQRGISQYPTIDDEVHLVSEEDLASIYGRSAGQRHLVRIGHIAGADAIDALVDVNKLVTRHSAIVGTTGSGKSTTVAQILSILSDRQRFPAARIVILDIHGEYARALGERANVYRITPDERNVGEHALNLPFWALTFDEFLNVAFGPLPPDSKARAIILEKVLSLKRAALKPEFGVSPEELSVDSPVPFSLHALWYALYCADFGTYYSAGGAAPVEANWAYEKDENGEPLKGDALKGIPPKFRSVKNVAGDPEKINYLPDSLNIRTSLENLGAKLRLPRFNFLFNPGPWLPDLAGATAQDLGDLLKGWIGADKPISILDLSGVPSTLTNDVIGILLRILFDALFWARNLSQGGRERPLLVVMEEAHAYLNDNLSGLASTIVGRIVKEGRKYGLGAMIVSQRPSEIHPTVLSQCGTFFALRLNNNTDRDHVIGTASDSLAGLTDMLPTLRTGEAIVLGEAVELPMRAMIERPAKDKRPDSEDPVVCDRAEPELSMHPGGWDIKMEPNPNYAEVARVWRKQNPRLTNKK